MMGAEAWRREFGVVAAEHLTCGADGVETVGLGGSVVAMPFRSFDFDDAFTGCLEDSNESGGVTAAPLHCPHPPLRAGSGKFNSTVIAGCVGGDLEVLDDTTGGVHHSDVAGVSVRVDAVYDLDMF